MDHPVLIPTTFGPVEGVVSAPEDRCHAAVVITHANGRAGRAGTNGVWARAARLLALRGAAVLRADYARGIDPGRQQDEEAAVWARDLAVRTDINTWFMHRLGAPEVALVGICRGARVALSLAAQDDRISALLLIATPLLEPAPPRQWLARRLRQNGREGEFRIDPRAEGDLFRVIERVPVTMICSDREANFLEGSLMPRARDLRLTAGPRLNRMESPEVQRAVIEHTVTWGAPVLA